MQLTRTFAPLLALLLLVAGCSGSETKKREYFEVEDAAMRQAPQVQF